MHIGNNFVPPVVTPTFIYRLGVRLARFKDRYLLGFGLVKDMGKG